MQYSFKTFNAAAKKNEITFEIRWNLIMKGIESLYTQIAINLEDHLAHQNLCDMKTSWQSIRPVGILLSILSSI